MNLKNDEYIKMLLNTKQMVSNVSELKHLPIEFSNLVWSMLPSSKSLFRYRAFSKENVEAFKNDKLYISSASYYSDIYDSLFRIDFNKQFEAINEQAKKACLVADNYNKNGVLPLEIETFFEDNNISGYSDRIEIDKNKVDTIVEQIKKDFLDNYYEDFKGIKNFCKSICFSECVDNKKMWDEYADGYKGFAL